MSEPDFPTGTAFVDGKPPEEAEYSLVFCGACAPRGLHEGLPGGGDGQCGGESSKEARGSFYEKAAFDSPEQAAEGNSGIRGFLRVWLFPPRRKHKRKHQRS